MKKILLFTFFFLINYFSFAQNEHGLKVGANFATMKTDVDYGSEISPLLCPNISYVYRSLGDNWGYFLELGYSQSGFNEQINNTETKLKVQNIDFLPVGVQYAFMSDWSKIRPVLQTSLGVRASLYAKATYPGGSDDSFLDQNYDILWSLGGGVMIGKHFTIIANYGGGFLDAIQSSTDWKNRQFQLSITFF